MSLATILLLLPTVVYALGLLATAISKVTATKRDDEIAAFLVTLHDLLVKFVPSGATLAQKRAPSVTVPTVHPKAG